MTADLMPISSLQDSPKMSLHQSTPPMQLTREESECSFPSPIPLLATSTTSLSQASRASDWLKSKSGVIRQRPRLSDGVKVEAKAKALEGLKNANSAQ
jgi:hypothetical protein